MSHDAVNNSGGVVESLLYIMVSFRITKLRTKNAYNSYWLSRDRTFNWLQNVGVILRL
jgi:hypothetical protein